MARNNRLSQRSARVAGAIAVASVVAAGGTTALAGTADPSDARSTAAGPTVVNGVATYHSDTTIGRHLVPDSWKKIVIGKNVTVRGSFLIPGNRTTALTIRGKNAKTSKLVGSGPHIKDASYAAVSTTADIDLTLRNFTSLNPRHFHLIAKKAKVLVSGMRVIDDRDEYHNNSDGFGGGDGSVVENSYFDTWDDTFKIYNGLLTVRNTTVVHNGNGAPVQMAWGDYGHGKLIADGLKVVSNSRAHYNQGVFSWAGGTRADSRSVEITGEGLIRTSNQGMREAPLYVWKKNVRNKTINLRGGSCSMLRSTASNTVFEQGARNNSVNVTDCD